jgi:hypothetical protein
MMRQMPRDGGSILVLTTEKTMTDNGLSTWTPRQVDRTFQCIDALQTEHHRGVSADAAQQYERLLSDLRDAGMAIARWHDLVPNAAGGFSEYQLRDSLDVLTKLVEDATDTRQPTGAWS